MHNQIRSSDNTQNHAAMVTKHLDPLRPSSHILFLNVQRIEEANLVKEFCEAESDEEKFLHQQAKIKWLCDGDKNSSYFHRVLKGRNNKILDSCDTLFKEKLSSTDASKMITDSEIKRALFEIKDSKAPGPNGFTAAFFKQAWSIIGVDTCATVKEFFDYGKMLGELNATLVSLIPKFHTPEKVNDFRPISCCNVLYKGISKIITNRIKPYLGKLVSCNQSAFIPGRHIQDNILLTLEIMRGYNRKGGPKRVAFKIDIQKAYDIVNWEFLTNVLKGFGFHEKMVNWIMQCVSTAAFTLNVNGDRFGYFKGGRGLRQGDPISPYLFTLIMEMTSCTGSMNEEEFKAISSILPFVTGKLPVKYLGVPLIAKRLGVRDCGRLQLITALLESIHMYWASVFLLPITVIKDINKLLKNFLWSQNDTTKGKAKVAWSTICNPKDQGGLGLKDLQVWNQALLSKHVWNIAGLKESLWNVSMWFDNWSEIGPLFQYITYRDIYDERLDRGLKVSDMIDNSGWMWPNDWYGKFPMITSLNVPTISTGSDDKICPFSSDVWNRAQMTGDMNLNMNDWQRIIQDMSDADNSNSIKSIIRRLLLAASVYHIWQERNNRIFKDSMKSSVEVFKGIVEVIKYKRLGIIMKDSKAVTDVEDKWKISCKKYKKRS
ncbi:RNA-directed DNA polymerase, eukaryota, reverse transcriptase zinc-binding domain protein [Tanacetum coccineum]